MDLLLEARKIRYYCLVLPHTLLSSLSHCYMYFLHNNNIGLKIVDTCSTGLPKLSSRDSPIQVVWKLHFCVLFSSLVNTQPEIIYL